MPRLPQTSIDWLKDTEEKFTRFTGMEGFRYKDFENKAEKLEKKNPGKGYQLAYEDAMCDLFGKLLDTYVERKENAVPLRGFMYYTDTLFDMFVGERKVQKMPVSIKPIEGISDPNMLKRFAKVWHDRNPSTICADVQAKFDRWDYTLWSVHRNAKAKKNTVPTRREAIELIAQEFVLRNRNQDRPPFLKWLLYPIHAKELRAIEDLKALACKAGDYYDLLREAKYENPMLDEVKDRLTEAIIEMQRRTPDPWIEKEDAKKIDDYVEKERKLDKKGIESKEFQQILDQIGYGAKEAVLDETIDLGNDVIEDGAKEDDGVSFEALLDSDADLDDPVADAPTDTLNTFEKVEFNEAEFNMFPYNGDAGKNEPDDPIKEKSISKAK